MKKIFYLFIFYVFLVAPKISFAVEMGAGGDGGKIGNPIAANSLPEFFKSIILAFTQLGTVVAVLCIMYGGFQYATAQGNEEKLAQAQKTVTWALVGTAVLIGAQVIITAVVGTVNQL